MVNIAIELQCKKNVPDVFKTICPVFGGTVVICMNLQSTPSKIVDTWIHFARKLTVADFSFHRIMDLCTSIP